MTTSSTRIDPSRDTTSVLVPRRATLEGFAEAAAASEGVLLRDLDPLTTLHVRTRNSQYRIVVSHGTAVFVEGGRFFPDPTDARVEGSSFGGSFLKLGWIGVGLCMEILAHGQRIVTSPVRSITRDAQARPH